MSIFIHLVHGELNSIPSNRMREIKKPSHVKHNNDLYNSDNGVVRNNFVLIEFHGIMMERVDQISE